MDTFLFLFFFNQKLIFSSTTYSKNNSTTTTYFITFLQTVDVNNSYWFSFKPTTNITFLLANKYSSHQQLIKNKNCKIVCIIIGELALMTRKCLRILRI